MRRLLAPLSILLVSALLLAPGPGSTATAASRDSTGLTADESLAEVKDALARDAGRDGATEAGHDDGELTLLLRDLWLGRGALEPGQRRAARRMLARPSDPAAHAAWRYPAQTEVRRSCTDRLCVTHVAQGEHAAAPDWVRTTRDSVDAAWRHIVDDLGYRAPAQDGEAGGDARFDVYLADLSSERGLYGFCAPEKMLAGHDARATAYCVLDNDMAGLGADPAEALAATAAHEFFHAVQFNYDVAEDPWFMEASATWIEGEVFAGVHDNRQFLREGQLGRPTTPLDSLTGRYGNWIFVQFLAQRGGTEAVRRIWERLDASPGARDEWSVQGVRRHFTARGDAWPRLYSDFVRANVRPAQHYAGGASFRRARFTHRARVARRHRDVRRTAWLPHLSSHTLKVKVGPLARRQRRLQLDLRTTRLPHATVQVLVQHRNGSVGLRRVTLRRDRTTRAGRAGRAGRATVRVKVRAKVRGRRVRHVVILTSHSGASHRRCGGNSGWACGGDPVGPLRLRVRARLVS